MEMVTLAVEDTALYASLQGKLVRIPVGIMADGRNIIYYAQKGAKPEVARELSKVG